jgi:hypothetical protein
MPNKCSEESLLKARLRYVNNKEEMKEKNRERYKNMTPEQKARRKETDRLYRLANWEKKKIQEKAWRDANIEHVLARDKAYRERNKEKINEARRKRITIERINTIYGVKLDDDLYAMYNENREIYNKVFRQLKQNKKDNITYTGVNPQLVEHFTNHIIL